MKPTKRNTRSSARSGKRSPAVNGSANAAATKTAKQGTRAKNTAPSIPVTPRALAMARLHVTPEQLDRAPDITTPLKEGAGGLSRVFSAMRFSQDEIIVAFLDKYDSLAPTDRKTLPLQAVALAAGISINHLYGSIKLAQREYEHGVVQTLLTTSQHKVTESRIKYAQTPSGHRDRDAFDMETGLLPSPSKGGGTFINRANIFGSGASVMNEQRSIGQGGKDEDEDEDEDGVPMDIDNIDIEKLFPAPNKMQEILTPIRQRLLPPGEGDENTRQRISLGRKAAMEPERMTPDEWDTYMRLDPKRCEVLLKDAKKNGSNASNAWTWATAKKDADED